MTEQVKRNNTPLAKGCNFSQKRRQNSAKPISGRKYSNSVTNNNDCMTLYNSYQGIFNEQPNGNYRYLPRYAPPSDCGNSINVQPTQNASLHYPQNQQTGPVHAPYYWLGSSQLIENEAPPSHIPASSAPGTDIQIPSFPHQTRLPIQGEHEKICSLSPMWRTQPDARIDFENHWLHTGKQYEEGEADLFRSHVPPVDVLDSDQNFRAHCNCDSYQYSGHCYCYEPPINYRLGNPGKAGNSLSIKEMAEPEVSFEHSPISNDRIITVKSKVERSIGINRILFTSNEDYAQEQLMQKEFQWLNNTLLQDDDISEPIIHPPDLDQVSVETVISSENQYDSIGSCKSCTESKRSLPVHNINQLQSLQVTRVSPPASTEITHPKTKYKQITFPSPDKLNNKGESEKQPKISKPTPFEKLCERLSPYLKSASQNANTMEEAVGRTYHAKHVAQEPFTKYPAGKDNETNGKSLLMNPRPIPIPLYSSLELPISFTGSSESISRMSHVHQSPSIISVSDIRTSSASFVGLCQGHDPWTPSPVIDAQLYLPQGIVLLRLEYQPKIKTQNTFPANHKLQGNLDQEKEPSPCVNLTVPLVHAMRFDPDGSVRLNLTFDILYDKSQGTS